MATNHKQKERKYKLFATEFVKNGGNATQAYLTVYNPKNDKTAASSASRLLRHDKVIQFIDEIEKELKNQAIITKEEIIHSHIDIRDKALNDKKYGDAIKANSEISRLTGMYEPEKTETKGDIKIKIIPLEDDE